MTFFQTYLCIYTKYSVLQMCLKILQTIKPADIATVRKLAKPPHLIMRIMDCCLLLFQKKLDTVSIDPERRCIKPSWGEALKVTKKHFYKISVFGILLQVLTTSTL